MVEWPVKECNGLKLHHKFTRELVKVQSCILKGTLNQQPIYGTIYPIDESMNLRMNGWMEGRRDLIVTHNNHPQSLASCPHNF